MVLVENSSIVMEKLQPNIIQVAVGVVLRTDSNGALNVLIAKRHAHLHQGGKWEFPGGKISSNETVSQALKRELLEEVGIEVYSSAVLTEVLHHYPDKSVRLHVYVVTDFSGEAFGAEGQELKWLPVTELVADEFPEANDKIIKCLQDLLSSIKLGA